MAPNIFINKEENRPRALWRILLQGILFFAGVILVNVLVGLAVVLVVSITTGNVRDQQALQAATASPITRIAIGLCSLLAAWLSYRIAGRWLDRRSFADFGFHFGPGWWTDFGFGLALGAVLMVFIFVIELSAGWVTITGTLQAGRAGGSFWAWIFANLVFFICVGFYEEMLSRGYELRNLAEGLNFEWLSPRTALLLAYLISSSMFGLFHLFNANTSWVSTVNLIVAGLFLGLGYVLTGELAIPIGLHITWNFFQGNVFGFPVSGSSSGTSFIAIQQGGPLAWTGGPFGPEAGVIGLVAIALGCLLIVLWVRWRYGAARLKESLAVYQRADEAMTAGEPVAEEKMVDRLPQD